MGKTSQKNSNSIKGQIKRPAPQPPCSIVTLVIPTSPQLYCLPHPSHLKTQPDLILMQASQKLFKFRLCTSLFLVSCWALSQVQTNLKILFNSQLGFEALTSQFRFPGFCQVQTPTYPFPSTSLLSVAYQRRENQ